MKNNPTSSARGKRVNLTLADWLTVFSFVDAHPDLRQGAVVEHFRSLNDGALIFTQSTLSRKLEARSTLEARVHSYPNALSKKRPRVVTRPDVERGLVLWKGSMEAKRETITVPMLIEKRRRLEEQLEVPDEQRLSGIGWVASFCKAYGLKEFQQHGEAASADIAEVEKERVRMQEVLVPYEKRNRWNFDETVFFAFAPPDRGLAGQQMSGKKRSKFRITVGFACNADGSEKWPLMFIGKSQSPRCFRRKSAAQLGFNYKSNKKAWMTSALFQEFIQEMDLQMRKQKRKIVLTIDNFREHDIDYSPTNVLLNCFAPNLTSFIQPLDAGIIRCFKAYYRHSFCKRALDLDEAGERDIYKLDLLEVMHLAREAWDNVSQETITHCWDHTDIQRDPIILSHSSPSGNERDNTAVAFLSQAQTEQCAVLEADLIVSVQKLQARNRIFGDLPTVEDLVNPVEELEVGATEFQFENGDKDIVAQVHLEQQIALGNIIETDSDDEEEGDEGQIQPLTTGEIMELCRKLEVSCLGTGVDSAFELSQLLRRFRGQLRGIEMRNAKQTQLTRWIKV